MSDIREPSPAFLPGLEPTQRRNPGYEPVSFCGRDYDNENDGWTYVSHKRKYKSKRRERRVAKAAATATN